MSVQDEPTRLNRVAFSLMVPYTEGAPLSPMPNVTCNATNATRTRANTTCANLTSTCVESTATCPPETEASCKFCTDQANYPCYKAPFGYKPVVAGRCYAPDGTWAAFDDGDIPLYVSVLGDQYVQNHHYHHYHHYQRHYDFHHFQSPPPVVTITTPRLLLQ